MVQNEGKLLNNFMVIGDRDIEKLGINEYHKGPNISILKKYLLALAEYVVGKPYFNYEFSCMKEVYRRDFNGVMVDSLGYLYINIYETLDEKMTNRLHKLDKYRVGFVRKISNIR